MASICSPELVEEQFVGLRVEGSKKRFVRSPQLKLRFANDVKDAPALRQKLGNQLNFAPSFPRIQADEKSRVKLVMSCFGFFGRSIKV
jgi:hypothetical protein